MGILSTSVVSMKIVMGTGEVLNLSETNNRELFRCCQLAIGSLGIIVELTIRVQQSFDLLENNSQVDFSSFLKMETLKPALQKNKYLKLWCLPYKPYIARLWVQNEEKRSPKYDTLFNRIHHYLDRDFLTPYVFMPLLNTIIEMHKFSPKLYFFATFYRIVGPLFASSKNVNSAFILSSYILTLNFFFFFKSYLEKVLKSCILVIYLFMWNQNIAFRSKRLLIIWSKFRNWLRKRSFAPHYQQRFVS